MSAQDPITPSKTTKNSHGNHQQQQQQTPPCRHQSPSSSKKYLITLADKSVSIVGLIQQKTCCCDKCKACGKCCLPDSDRDAALRKFQDGIATDRLERLGTYAQDFGDSKIVKRGDNSIYIRPVRVRGEHFSVAYKLTVAQTTTPSTPESRPSQTAQELRLLRQKSQG